MVRGLLIHVTSQGEFYGGDGAPHLRPNVLVQGQQLMMSVSTNLTTLACCLPLCRRMGPRPEHGKAPPLSMSGGALVRR